ncbi:hypothetical protein H6F67_07465 [Microcoleus sp. FACHB-1515]|uniref:hypothetical protein n=1 Tax=Cyanophyceae TaxID=3028117 RepID=UPI001686B7C2|nr:hypothetical protein [Microcoleus sp. FACHB-1515]MBD2089690.1 hypothetical protein [Microcoleus sp. FACHB-1515]
MGWRCGRAAPKHTARQMRGQTFSLGQLFVQKELHRGHLAEAIANYHKLTIKPLVELLGMLHRPDRYDYGFKYFDRDFPSEVNSKITEMMCIRDLEDLQAKQQATDWFDRTFTKIIRVSSSP